MTKLIFAWMLLTGQVTRTEDHEGHKQYKLNLGDDLRAEYAYKEEVLEFIETGNFEYNEDLVFNNQKNK
jgi:hypothetical protein